MQILNLTTPEGQYHAVAGYDAQARRRMTAAQRKNTRPNIDREDAIVLDNGVKSEYNYTEDEYNAYGWTYANGILDDGQMKDFSSKFAEALNGYKAFQKTKRGEFMIPVSRIYDPVLEGVNNTIIYVRGTIEVPIITRVLEIDEYEYDGSVLDKIRRRVYAIERRGIQQTSRGVFRQYTSANFRSGSNLQGSGLQVQRHNVGLGSNRGGSGATVKGVARRSPYLPVVYTFTDVAKRKQNVLRVDRQYMVKNDSPNGPYKSTIEEAVNSFKERIIRRHASKSSLTPGEGKRNLAADSVG